MQQSSPKRPFLALGYSPDSLPICAKCSRDIPLDQINTFSPCGCSQYHPRCVEELEAAEIHDYHHVHLTQPQSLRCHACRKQVDSIVYGYRNGQFLQIRTPSVGLQSPISPDPNHFTTFVSPIQLPNNNHHHFPGSFRDPTSGITSTHRMSFPERPISDWQDSNNRQDRQPTNMLYPASTIQMSNSLPSITVPSTVNGLGFRQNSNLEYPIQQQDTPNFVNPNSNYQDLLPEQDKTKGRPINHGHTVRQSFSFDPTKYPIVKNPEDTDNNVADPQTTPKFEHEIQGRRSQPRKHLIKHNTHPEIHIHFGRRWTQRPRIRGQRGRSKINNHGHEKGKQTERNEAVHIYIDEPMEANSDVGCLCFRGSHQNRRERRKSRLNDNCCIC